MERIATSLFRQIFKLLQILKGKVCDSSRYWNFVTPGRTGSGYAGFLEYKQIPEELSKHVKPAIPAPRKKCHTNLARSGLDSEQIEAALAAM